MSRNATHFLTTKRLGFRRWSLDDLPLAVELWCDPRVTSLLGGPFSQLQIEERLTREIAMMRDSGVQYWPIFWLEDDDFVGCCGLRPYKPEAQIFEIGFHLRPAYWHKGLAIEASQAVIRFAFTTVGAKSLFAGHHPSNAASKRILQKLGFRHTHDEIYPPTGLMNPSYELVPASEAPLR